MSTRVDNAKNTQHVVWFFVLSHIPNLNINFPKAQIRLVKFLFALLYIFIKYLICENIMLHISFIESFFFLFLFDTI